MLGQLGAQELPTLPLACDLQAPAAANVTRSLAAEIQERGNRETALLVRHA